MAPLHDQLAQPGFLENEALGVTAKVHLYGKKEAKEKRKMGHINLLTSDVEKALTWIEKTGIWESK
ncbi:phosphoribosylaminoimidazole carboxylase ATPase subunit [compost metagenome]